MDIYLTQEEIDVRIAPGPHAKWHIVRMVSNGPKFQTYELSNGNTLKIDKVTGRIQVI